MMDLGLITRRAPSRVHVGRAEAVWDPITPERDAMIRAHLFGLSVVASRASASERFKQAIIDAYRAGKIDGRLNPVSLLSKFSKSGLTDTDHSYLASLSVEHLQCVWVKYAKAEAKGADPEGRTPAFARYTGHTIMAQLAATHPHYGTLVFSPEGEPLGARIYPVRNDTSLPLSHDNVRWEAEDPQPRKRGRRKGCKLSDAQKAEIRIKLRYTRQRNAKKFREQWQNDPELRRQFPEHTLPKSLRPDYSPAEEKYSEKDLNEMADAASIGYTPQSSCPIHHESATV